MIDDANTGQSNLFNFQKLQIVDYGVFWGVNEVEFNQHQTIIFGSGGSGKTTITEILKNLGPINDIKKNRFSNASDFSVKLEYQGDPDQFKKYSRFTFLNGTDLDDFTLSTFDNVKQKNINELADVFFNKMLNYKTHKMDSHLSSQFDKMSMSEKMVYFYAYFFAVRNILDIILPLILDSPLGRMDYKCRKGVAEFVNNEKSQQIILLRFEEELIEFEHPHYKIENTNKGSKIFKQ